MINLNVFQVKLNYFNCFNLLKHFWYYISISKGKTMKCTNQHLSAFLTLHIPQTVCRHAKHFLNKRLINVPRK